MTDEINVSQDNSQSTETIVSNENNAVESNQQAETPTQPAQDQGHTEARNDQDKMRGYIPRGDVGKIVNAETKKALEKERAKIQAEIEERYKSKYSANDFSKQKSDKDVDRTTIQEVVSESIGELIRKNKEEQEKKFRQQEEESALGKANEIIKEFSSRLEAGKDRYEDFSEKVGSLPLAKIPEIVQLALKVDNTADVMYELAENPSKMLNIAKLANDYGEEFALKEMNKLSNSIKANDYALNKQKPNKPLSQASPSVKAGKDMGVMTTSDYRKIL